MWLEKRVPVPQTTSLTGLPLPSIVLSEPLVARLPNDVLVPRSPADVLPRRLPELLLPPILSHMLLLILAPPSVWVAPPVEWVAPSAESCLNMWHSKQLRNSLTVSSWSCWKVTRVLFWCISSYLTSSDSNWCSSSGVSDNSLHSDCQKQNKYISFPNRITGKTLYSLMMPGGITQWIPDDALRHHLVTTR